MKVKGLKPLSRKMLTPSILMIVIITLIGVVSFRYYFKQEFDKYIGNKTSLEIEEVIRDVSHQYDNDGIRLEEIESICMNALEKGMFISIYDKNNKEVWNVENHYQGMCKSMTENIITNMKGKKQSNDTFDVHTQSIRDGGDIIGYVKVKYYGPVFYLDSEIQLIKVADRIIILIGIVLIISYLIISIMISKKVEDQINFVMLKAKYIAEGDYDREINTETDILEISNLVESINRLSQSIKEQEIIRKRLTGDISHELKTPLTNIQSHLEAMIDGIWEPTNTRLISVKEEAERLTGLVLDMQNLNKYDEDSISLNIESFDISSVIDNILLNFSSLLSGRKINVIFKSNKNFVCADKAKITQALINLISNAMKYSKDSGEIKISLENDNEAITIEIKDNGIGISEDDLPYIFERFYRTDKSRTRLTGGTGIGLTITKAIIEAHKGKIIAESRLGEGSEFKVTIPTKKIK